MASPPSRIEKGFQAGSRSLHDSWPSGTGCLPGVEKENAFPARLLKRILLFLPGREVTLGAPTAERPTRPLLPPLAPRNPYKSVSPDRDGGSMAIIGLSALNLGAGLVIPATARKRDEREPLTP
jgi:hypothetical protein